MPSGRPWEYFDDDYYGQQRQAVAGLPPGPRTMAPVQMPPPQAFAQPPMSAPTTATPRRPNVPVNRPAKSNSPGIGSRLAQAALSIGGAIVAPFAPPVGAAMIATGNMAPAIETAAKSGSAAEGATRVANTAAQGLTSINAASSEERRRRFEEEERRRLAGRV